MKFQKKKNYFDNLEDEEIMVYHNNISEFEDDLNIISKELVSWLEENFYNCYFADKVYLQNKTIRRKRSILHMAL